MLRNSKDCPCLMLKTPMKLMKRSQSTPILFLTIIIINYLLLLFFVFPCKNRSFLFGYRFGKPWLVYCWYSGHESCTFIFFFIKYERPRLLIKAYKSLFPSNNNHPVLIYLYSNLCRVSTLFSFAQIVKS